MPQHPFHQDVLPDTFMPITARINANLTATSFRGGFADLPPEKAEAAHTVTRPIRRFPTHGVDGDRWLDWYRTQNRFLLT